jgi:ankyrin repeat protein
MKMEETLFIDFDFLLRKAMSTCCNVLNHVNEPDNFGHTPLDYAIYYTSEDTNNTCEQILLEEESSLKKIHKILDLSEIIEKENVEDQSEEVSSINSYNVEESDVPSSCYDVDTINDNVTKIVAKLIQLGASVCREYSEGWTPLHIAAKENNLPLAMSICNQEPLLIIEKTHTGQTPLHFAVYNNSLKIIPFLLFHYRKCILNPNLSAYIAENNFIDFIKIQNDEKQSALKIAKKNKNQKIIDMLKSEQDALKTAQQFQQQMNIIK